jgi:hypothetical protein
VNEREIDGSALTHPFLHEHRNEFAHLTRHIVFNNEGVRLEEIEAVHNDGLAKVENGFQVEAGQVSGKHGTVFSVDFELDRGELDDFNALVEKDLGNRTTRYYQKINLRPPFPYAGYDGQGTEGVAQTDRIVGVDKNPFDIPVPHRLAASHVSPQNFLVSYPLKI